MENEVKKVVFIEEKTYQQMKKKMGKTNNYFSEKEFERLGEIQAKLWFKIKTSFPIFHLLFYLLLEFGLNNNL